VRTITRAAKALRIKRPGSCWVFSDTDREQIQGHIHQKPPQATPVLHKTPQPRATLKQVQVRMPDELIEQIKQKAIELSTATDSLVNFSLALRHLVIIGLKASNGHDGESSNVNPASSVPSA